MIFLAIGVAAAIFLFSSASGLVLGWLAFLGERKRLKREARIRAWYGGEPPSHVNVLPKEGE